MQQLWNANIHYHRLVLASLPPDASRVLDVGCGDGILAAQLLDAGVSHVTGLDLDRPVLDRARARHTGRTIEWLHGDVLEVTLEPGSFDAVVSVASLHHMDAGRSLAMKVLSARVLPGVRYRRHLLGRYSLVWRKPGGAS